MPPKKKTSPPLIMALIIAGVLVVAWAGEKLWEVRPRDESAGNPLPLSTVAGDEAESLAALREIQDERKIVNVHEHIQSVEDAARMLNVMNEYGIEKTVLMGSSWFTITLDESVGFTRYDENNDELIKIVNTFPGRFEAWPTIEPDDPQKLEKLRSLHSRGATGLKLYLGHGYVKRSDGKYMFHTMALDDPRMLPVYEYCEANYLPIMFHVQPHGGRGPGIAEEFIAVLTAYPDMKVIAPHFILSSIKDSRLQEFLDTFPNLYTDISFGHDDFLVPGLKRISKDPGKFIGLLQKYPDRFTWGTDLVLTNYEGKDEPWIAVRVQAYLDILTKEAFTTPLVPDGALRGMMLGEDLLRRLLYQNYNDMMASRPQGTQITHEFDWANTGVEPTGRQPGQFFPPNPR